MHCRFVSVPLFSMLAAMGAAGPIRVGTTVFAPVSGSQLTIQAAAASPDGGLYVYSQRRDPGASADSGYLVRLSAGGVRQWGKAINQNQFSGGTSGAQRTVRLLPTADNGVILFHEAKTGLPDSADVILRRFAVGGTLLASRSLAKSIGSGYPGANVGRASAVIDASGRTWVGFNFWTPNNAITGHVTAAIDSLTLADVAKTVRQNNLFAASAMLGLSNSTGGVRAIYSAQEFAPTAASVTSYAAAIQTGAVTLSEPTVFDSLVDPANPPRFANLQDYAVSGTTQLAAVQDLDEPNLLNITAHGPTLRTLTTLDSSAQNDFVSAVASGPNLVAFAHEAWEPIRSGFVASISYVGQENGAPAFAGGAVLPGFANEWRLDGLAADPARRTVFVPGGSSNPAAPFPVGLCLNQYAELIYRINSPVADASYSHILPAAGRRIWAVGTDSLKRLVAVQYREPEYFVGISGQSAPVPVGTDTLLRFHFSKAATDGGYPITVLFDPRVFTQRAITFRVFGGTDVELPVSVRADAPVGPTVVTARTNGAFDEAATHSALIEIQ